MNSPGARLAQNSPRLSISTERRKAGRRYPLDIELGIPWDGFSMRLRSLATRIATKTSYAQNVAVTGMFLHWSPCQKTVEEMVPGLGRHTGEWFETVPAPKDDGDVLIVQIDGKGTPTATESELNKRRGKRKKNPPPRFAKTRRQDGSQASGAEEAQEKGRQVQKRENGGGSGHVHLTVHRNPTVEYNVKFGKLEIKSPYLWIEGTGSKPLIDEMGITRQGRSFAVKNFVFIRPMPQGSDDQVFGPCAFGLIVFGKKASVFCAVFCKELLVLAGDFLRIETFDFLRVLGPEDLVEHLVLYAEITEIGAAALDDVGLDQSEHLFFQFRIGHGKIV